MESQSGNTDAGGATRLPSSQPPRAVNDREWQLSVTIVLLVLGGLIGAQFHTERAAEKMAADQRPEVLLQRFADANKKIDVLNAEVTRLRQTVTKYEAAAADQQRLAKTMNSEIQRARTAAGLLPVKGPGILVKLADSPLRAPDTEGQNALNIHDVDLLQLINELKAAGAEALCVNEQRVTAMTEVRCSGPVIKVNGTAIGAPYEVRAIGSPEALESAMNLPGGIIETLTQAFQIRAEIHKAKEIEIPAAETAPAFKYAVPIPPAAQSKPEESR